MAELFDTAIVEKRNVLNELRSNNMTLQELRFFSIYLSKINPWDTSTRVVRFPLDDFRRIMGLGSDMNITHFRYTIRHILQQVVEVPNEKGSGYTAFQLFKRAKIEKDEQNDWYVEFDAHDDALPLMFDFKNRYFKYELWNALHLKSTNQVRMYEVLKQYEGLGKRELTIAELRELLSIGKNEYDRWERFRTRVLDSCQQALKENTDICYTYERGKTGKGGKWLTIVFHIKRNEDYKDQLSLDEFISQQPDLRPLDTMDNDDDSNTLDWDGQFEANISVYGTKMLTVLASAVNYEFNKDQMSVIYHILTRIDIPKDRYTNDLTWGRHSYLEQKYAELNAAAKRNLEKGTPIKNRFAYFTCMLENDTFEPVAYT